MTNDNTDDENEEQIPQPRDSGIEDLFGGDPILFPDNPVDESDIDKILYSEDSS